jgi:hypothetical protein
MTNIGNEGTVLSYFLEVSFMILLACHIPYVFFLGKEGACVVVDEVMTGSMSKSLEARTRKDAPQLGNEVIVYHNMNVYAYVITTLVLYILCIVVSCLTQNLGALFNYIGAFSVSGIQFFVPGMAIVNLSKGHPLRD